MRNPKLIVSGSSYDRGLEHLLKMWPDVLKEVPEAQLKIFYGWELFDRMHGNNPERHAWKEKMQGLMKQPGITHLGRISHDACVKEFESAGVWAYPTHFGEISCITAMRAQALGAVPVVIDYAALQETVQHGIKVPGDIWDTEVKEKFKSELIALLKDEKRQEEIRAEMIPWAKEKFTWSKVAEQWEEEFKGVSSLERQVESLMDDNQPLKAWDLVKDTDSPLKERVYLRVKHAFEPEVYKKYYSEELTELPVDGDIYLRMDEGWPRFGWIIPRIRVLKPKSVLDLGCADGGVCLTLAKDGIKCIGINLYGPSVELATRRAEALKLPATFKKEDLFDTTDKADVVVMMEVLEHLPDPQKGVDKAMSLLNEGGTAFFSTPSTEHVGIKQHKEEVGREGWDDGKPSGHLRLFTEDEFKNLFRSYKIKEFFVDDEKCMITEVVKK